MGKTRLKNCKMAKPVSTSLGFSTHLNCGFHQKLWTTCSALWKFLLCWLTRWSFHNMTFSLVPSSHSPDSGTSVQPHFQLVVSFLFPHHQVLKLVWGPSIRRKEVSWLQKTFHVASMHKREQQGIGEERRGPSWGWHRRKGGCHAPEPGWDTETSFITHEPHNHICLAVERPAFQMKSI